DLTAGIITVRYGKRGRKRLIPLHPSAIGPLNHYISARADVYGAPNPGEAFFRTERSQALSYNTVAHTFTRLRATLGWRGCGRTRAPRIHELRHRMIVRRIQTWCAEGADVDAKMPVLATYVGHTEIGNLYWYLSAAPELMTTISERFESYAATS